jgi:hypothetical protein
MAEGRRPAAQGRRMCSASKCPWRAHRSSANATYMTDIPDNVGIALFTKDRPAFVPSEFC